MVAGTTSLAKVEELSERMSQPTRRLLGIRRRLPDTIDVTPIPAHTKNRNLFDFAESSTDPQG